MIEIKEAGMTKEALVILREIDLQFYPNIDSIDWCLARYKPWRTYMLKVVKRNQ